MSKRARMFWKVSSNAVLTLVLAFLSVGHCTLSAILFSDFSFSWLLSSVGLRIVAAVVEWSLHPTAIAVQPSFVVFERVWSFKRRGPVRVTMLAEWSVGGSVKSDLTQNHDKTYTVNWSKYYCYRSWMFSASLFFLLVVRSGECQHTAIFVW